LPVHLAGASTTRTARLGGGLPLLFHLLDYLPAALLRSLGSRADLYQPLLACPVSQNQNSDKWPLRTQGLLPLIEGCTLILPRDLRMMLAGDVNVRQYQGLGDGQYTRNLVR
jgi:hypothetical protein